MVIVISDALSVLYAGELPALGPGISSVSFCQHIAAAVIRHGGTAPCKELVLPACGKGPCGRLVEQGSCTALLHSRW